MKSFFLLCSLLALTGLQLAYAGPEDDMMAEMLGGQQFGRGKETKALYVKSDLPFIKCGVCEAAAKQMLRMVAKLREEATKAKPVSERSDLRVLHTTRRGKAAGLPPICIAVALHADVTIALRV